VGCEAKTAGSFLVLRPGSAGGSGQRVRAESRAGGAADFGQTGAEEPRGASKDGVGGALGLSSAMERSQERG
jgi:hypothetical protein